MSTSSLTLAKIKAISLTQKHYVYNYIERDGTDCIIRVTDDGTA